MRLPMDALRERMLSGLHDAGFTDLVAAHLTVLRYPGPENQRPSDLAAETRMTKQALNYLLGQMEQLGYLIRTGDPDDLRSKRIHLTKRGHAAVQNLRDTVGQIELELARELGSEQFTQLRQLLIELNATDVVRGSQRSQPSTGPVGKQLPPHASATIPGREPPR